MSATERSAQPTHFSPFDLVVIVASLGGHVPTQAVFAALPETFPASIVLVQHRPHTDEGERLARLLQKRARLPVRTARSGESVLVPGISVVPGGRTAIVGSDFTFRFTDYDRRGGGTALFVSAAATFGKRVIGVVLSGMLCDGSLGVKAIKREGGRTIAQDPATADAPGMPTSAIATGCVDFVLTATRIGPALIALVMAPGGAELLAVGRTDDVTSSEPATRLD
jgi:two-component system chemotaxis response regulator CheB